MSNVRLSNGSPPLERVERLADHVRPPVCRALFGGESAAEQRRESAEQLREMERASRDRWNYDFALDQPLSPGQYEWEAVDVSSVPDFYSRPPRGAQTRRAADRAPARRTPSPDPGLENGAHGGEDGEEDGQGEAAGGGGQGEAGGGEGEGEREARGGEGGRQSRKRPSTEQQDGASQSKRPNSDAEETDHCPPDESLAVEQTPKKSPPPNT